MIQDDMSNTEHKRPLDLLNSGQLVKICAPMVRYSRLSFRTLIRKYKCDLAFTPMIVSSSFVNSAKARDNDFTTNKGDRPLIVQFAASNPSDLATAAELVYPFSDGVDLNCGCPQRWAAQEGYGACLINKPSLLASIIAETRNRIPDREFTVSIKIRIHNDLRKTVDLCQKLEKMGVSFISVHGRTRQQRAQPVSYSAIRLVKESVAVPVVANGDMRTIADCEKVQRDTGVDGVMCARGILSNPAMFAGYEETPLSCVQDWVDIAMATGTPFSAFHHHLMYMMENVTSRAEKRLFNGLSSTASVLDHLERDYGVHCRDVDVPVVSARESPLSTENVHVACTDS